MNVRDRDMRQINVGNAAGDRDNFDNAENDGGGSRSTTGMNDGSKTTAVNFEVTRRGNNAAVGNRDGEIQLKL
jgi:hypothetical protein